MSKWLIVTLMICFNTILLYGQNSMNILFPVKIGAVWEYSDAKEKPLKFYIEKDTFLNKETKVFKAVELRDSHVEGVRYFSNLHGMLFEFYKEDKYTTGLLYLPDRLQKGDSIYSYYENRDLACVVKGVNAKLMTPVQEYDSVIKIHCTINEKGISYFEYIKPGIGFVGSTNEEGELISYLISYTPGINSGEKIKDQSKVIIQYSKKIKKQMKERGWTIEMVDIAVRKGLKATGIINGITGNSSTKYYFDKRRYVVIDDWNRMVLFISK